MGSFICSCNLGYTLGSDKKTCLGKETRVVCIFRFFESGKKELKTPNRNVENNKVFPFGHKEHKFTVSQ